MTIKFANEQFKEAQKQVEVANVNLQNAYRQLEEAKRTNLPIGFTIDEAPRGGYRNMDYILKYKNKEIYSVSDSEEDPRLILANKARELYNGFKILSEIDPITYYG